MGRPVLSSQQKEELWERWKAGRSLADQQVFKLSRQEACLQILRKCKMKLCDFDTIDCSVIICTRNRHRQLEEALASMTALVIPPSLIWELIVVDNGSTDATPAVIESSKNTLPIRRVFEPLAGLSNARNAGVDAARGKYLVWTDDDVHVEPNMLAAFVDAFKRWPDARVFGGKITLYLLPPTPLWFLDAFDYLKQRLAARDFGPDPIPLSIANDRIPYGACFAVRAAEQRHYRYDPRLGRAPGQNRGCEETELIGSMLRANYSGWWVPGAEVKHVIPASRQTIEHVVQLYEGTGEDWAHLTNKSWRWTFLRVPLVLWFKLPISYIRFRLAYKMRSKAWPHYLGRLAWYRGVLNIVFANGRSKKLVCSNLETPTGAS
jgi:glycosyltransferase involved in cell wall biosynthesis